MARQRNRETVERERKMRSKRQPPERESTLIASSRREAARTCGWCGSPIEVRATGRIPKWCSASCRQRAWEQSRAAASGRVAVEVVERVVEVPVVRHEPPRRDGWPTLLIELARQLDQGRIYRRDLPSLAVALNQVQTALRRASR